MHDTTRQDGWPVRTWLWSVAVLIAVMVLVGGATRLTDSGLSITQWNPISGVIPPLSLADWQAEFSLYQTTTEFQTVNASMTLAQFKFIFWWEWGHRQLGRLIGLAVLLPLIGFWATGRLSRWLKPRAVLLFLGICAQGAIGWWMVASGLTDRVDVAPLRLAIHLTAACVVFAWTVWLALSISPATRRPSSKLASWALALVALVFVQIFAGGLVAGHDAGMAWNTWPKMDGKLVPDGLWLMAPGWLNLFENALTIQFVHRTTAYLVWIAVLLHWVQAARVDRAHAARAGLLFGAVCVQAVMGIATLVMQVPLSWALAHQFGAVVVLALTVWHWHAMQEPRAAVARPAPALDAAYGPT
ncbi:COX15/CtaA family protein [Rhizobiaceae bacterium]|nr:COX15/CtaA family protein [Rhizobiaceae bacterium]